MKTLAHLEKVLVQSPTDALLQAWNDLLAQIEAQKAPSIKNDLVVAAAQGVPRPPQVSSDEIWYAALDFTVRFEGKVPFMYNDFGNSNNVTYGIGVMPGVKGAELHRDGAFFYQQGNRAQRATPQTMDDDYDAVSKIVRKPYSLWLSLAKAHLKKVVTTQADLDFNKKILGDCFEFVTQMRLTDEGIGLTMARKLASKAKDSFGNATAAKRLQEFSKYPAQAQIACVAFWYGCVAPAAPKMCKALSVWDFDEASFQCWWSGLSPYKQLALRVLLYNAARIYERCHVKRNGEWVYDPLSPTARKLPEYQKDGTISVEPWLPWTEGEWDADTNKYVETPHTSPPPDLLEPRLKDKNPDKENPPRAFKYQNDFIQ